MSHTLSKGVGMAIALTPLLIACGGGDSGGTPSPINAPQCSGSSCGTQGAPVSSPLSAQSPQCPATADIGNSTYLGGSGSGEVASININATAMTYTLKWLESPVPLAAGSISPTRAGTTITGQVAHPPAGALPTAEQTRCAFMLLPGKGTSTTNATYSTAADFNQANPPTIVVGFGMAGGGIPGATIQYDGRSIIATALQNPGTQQILGILQSTKDLQTVNTFVQNLIKPPTDPDFLTNLTLGLKWGGVSALLANAGIKSEQLKQVQQILSVVQSPDVQNVLNAVQTATPQQIKQIALSNLGAVTNHHVDFYPFLGFASTTNDLSKLKGSYNGLIYHTVPSSGYATTGTTTVEAFDAQGNCTSSNSPNASYTPSTSGCLTTGNAWATNTSGYFDSASAPQIGTQFNFPGIGPDAVKSVSATLNQLPQFLTTPFTVPLLGTITISGFIDGLDPNMSSLLTRLAAALPEVAKLIQAASIPKAGTVASAHMVLGQLNGATIPLIVRTGSVNPGTAPYFLDAQVDDEAGIAVLGAATALHSGDIDGNYAGADSNFKYTAAIIKGATGTFLDPSSQQIEDGITLDYSQTLPGLIKLATNNATSVSGYLIATGGLYATLINGPVNGGLAPSSAMLGTAPSVSFVSSVPYLGIGTLLKK